MRKLQNVLMALSLLCFAVPAFADGGSGCRQPGANRHRHWYRPGRRLCGLGQGKAVGSAVEVGGAQPRRRGSIQLLMILGLAFIESLTLFTFAMIFIRIKP